MKIGLKTLATLLLSLSVSSHVLAHKDHDHSHGHNHGQPEAAETTMKIVMQMKKNRVVLAISDSGKKVPTKGASGKLMLDTSKGKTEVVLSPKGFNLMEAKLETKIEPGTKASAAIIFADSKTLNYELAMD